MDKPMIVMTDQDLTYIIDKVRKELDVEEFYYDTDLIFLIREVLKEVSND